MGIGEDDLLRCSVTVMPILGKKVGFLRRDVDDSYAGQLLAPGGSLETPDGIMVDGVKYHSVEAAAAREMWEKTGIRVPREALKYFCSMSLPTDRVTISLYCRVSYSQVARGYGFLEFYDRSGIARRDDFAPGMKQEALQLIRLLGLDE